VGVDRLPAKSNYFIVPIRPLADWYFNYARVRYAMSIRESTTLHDVMGRSSTIFTVAWRRSRRIRFPSDASLELSTRNLIAGNVKTPQPHAYQDAGVACRMNYAAEQFAFRWGSTITVVRNHDPVLSFRRSRRCLCGCRGACAWTVKAASMLRAQVVNDFPVPQTPSRRRPRRYVLSTKSHLSLSEHFRREVHQRRRHAVVSTYLGAPASIHLRVCDRFIG